MATAEKIDLYKVHRADYAAPKKPTFVDIAPATYLTVDGQGPPGGTAFSERIGALYGVAFTVKMTRKLDGKGDYAVCKLEALWWADGDRDLNETPQERWLWKLMIRTPDFVRPRELESAARKLTDKGKGAWTDTVALERIAEGRCVQMLHVGPYERSGDSVAIMAAYAGEHGLGVHGRRPRDLPVRSPARGSREAPDDPETSRPARLRPRPPATARAPRGDRPRAGCSGRLRP